MIDHRLEDASSLLILFSHSNWGELHVRSSDLEVYISRQNTSLNPMRHIDNLNVNPVSTAIAKAMHLGDFIADKAVGDSVDEGETLGWLKVLDEERPIVSDVSGVVSKVFVQQGDFVEHRASLFEITRSN